VARIPKGLEAHTDRACIEIPQHAQYVACVLRENSIEARTCEPLLKFYEFRDQERRGPGHLYSELSGISRSQGGDGHCAIVD
jgi:hypothetical protein